MLGLKHSKSNSSDDSSSKISAMKEIFEKARAVLPLLKVGEIVGGTIIERAKNALYLDLEGLGTGLIYGKEYLEAKDLLRDKQIGDKIFTKIVDLENEDGYVELSIKEAGRELNWQMLAQKKDAGETLEVKIVGANRGGLVAEILGISAFMPASQLASEHYPKVEAGDQNRILDELRKLVGKTFKAKIIDLDQREGKLIISERARETEKFKEVLNRLKAGDIVDGEIAGIVDFGAFVTFSIPPQTQIADAKTQELPPVKDAEAQEPKAQGQETHEKLEGLIHISELDWKMVHNPEDIVRIGDKIRAKIIDITRDGKISLSLRALKPNPWEEAEKKYKKGDVVSGEAVKFSPYGAFVELSDGLQGLCHISEFGSRKKMEEELMIGKKYDFKVLLVDAENHKISLGMANQVETDRNL